MSSQGHEILSLAFGHYSCHLATHYFNIQEASFSYNPNFATGINHDSLFRESLSQSNSFSPRLISVDDQESLGFLSKEGCYKENNEALPKVNLPISETIVQEPLWEKNDFLYDILKVKESLKSGNDLCPDLLLKSSYSLDEGVTSWSDYVITEFCDKTIITLPKNTEYYEKYETFSCFDNGLSLWQKTQLNTDVEESIRHFLEECDNLQGFQVLSDGGNGYSGISAGCLELLKDEYSKKAIIAMPAIYVDFTKTEDVRTMYKNKCNRIYSLASSFSSYSEFCDLIAPVSHLYNPWSKDPNVRLFRNIEYKYDLMYHTSALLATALDLITLPCRLQNSTSDLNSLATSLNIYGRQFVTVGLNAPVAVRSNEETLPALQKISGRFFESLTPMIDLSSEYIDVQSISSKGLGKHNLNAFTNELLHFKSVENDFKLFLSQLYPRVITKLSTCKSVFRVPRTFPKILDNHFNLTKYSHDLGPLSEFITIGGLHNSKEMYGMLNNIYQEAKGIKKGILSGLKPQESDIDHEELFENLKISTQAYLESSFL